MSKKKQVFRNVVGKNNYNEFLKQKKLKIVAKCFHPRCFRTACPDSRELHRFGGIGVATREDSCGSGGQNYTTDNPFWFWLVQVRFKN
jgi:hypothetical protein